MEQIVVDQSMKHLHQHEIGLVHCGMLAFLRSCEICLINFHLYLFTAEYPEQGIVARQSSGLDGN
jgi:hypothetical protein